MNGCVCVCRSVSKYLAQNGLKHKSLGFDYQGVEMVQVMREDLMAVCAAIYTDGWNYLRNQCGYDSEPGGDLVSVYHLCKMDPETNDSTPPPEEVSLQRLQRLRAQPSKVSLLDVLSVFVGPRLGLHRRCARPIDPRESMTSVGGGSAPDLIDEGRACRASIDRCALRFSCRVTTPRAPPSSPSGRRYVACFCLLLHRCCAWFPGCLGFPRQGFWAASCERVSSDVLVARAF